MAIGNVTFGGLASGLPSDMVDQLMQVEQRRLNILKSDKTAATKQKTSLTELGSKLSALSSTASTLQSESSWSPHSATSSDTDKVSASASYNAVAGTHSVEVSRLASSQTLMLAAGVTDTSDKISSAAPTLNFDYNGISYGTGTGANDFGIAQDDTLADISTKISNFNYGDDKGVSASVLYDGSSYRLVLTAKDQGAQNRNSDGTTGTPRLENFSVNMTWDTSDVTWDTGAVAGNTAVLTGSSAVGSSSVVDAVGQTLTFDYQNSTALYNVTITTAAGDTLSSIADKINALNRAGLKASAVNDGAQSRLVIDGSSDGTTSYLNPISNIVSGITFDAGATTLGTSWGSFQSNIGLDAKIKVDGLGNIYSTSNTVEDVLPGVTMTLKETTSTPLTVTVTDDTDTLKTTLNSFTTAFNDVINYINENKTGSLSGSTLARSIISQLRNELNTATHKDDSSGSQLSPFSILAELGLRTDQKTGKISFDSSNLDTALSTNFNVLSNLFTNTQNDVGTGNNAGLAHRIDDLLDNITNSTNGSLTGVKESADARITSLEKSIEREQTRLEKIRERLTKKFANLEQLVNSMNSQGSALTSALGKLR